MKRLTIFVKHAPDIADACAQIGAVLVIQNVVYASDGDLKFDNAVIEIAQQDFCLRTELSDFCFQFAEAHILIRFQSRAGRRTWSGIRSRNNPQKIVAERAVAGDGGSAIRFHGNVRLDAKNDFHAGGVVRVGADVLNAAYGRSTCVANLSAGAQSAGILEECAVRHIATIEKSRQRENSRDQKPCGNDNESSDNGFLAARGGGVHRPFNLLISGLASTSPEILFIAIPVTTRAERLGSITRWVNGSSPARDAPREAETEMRFIGEASALRRSASANSRSPG